MKNLTLTEESDNLQAIAVMNGRVKAAVFVRLRDTKALLHSDDFNPVASKQRDEFVGRLLEDYRDEATRLLGKIAERVAAARATPEKEEPTDDPFPAIEPYRTVVSGEALLDALVAFLESYMVLPAFAPVAIALWIIHTYLIDVTDYTPYLHVTSPVRECGKSTLLEILAWLAYRGFKTDSITPAALYRKNDKHHPTLFLDEIDVRVKMEGSEALRGVLNSGFRRSGKHTICVGDNHDDQDFSTWGPKVLAGIGRLWDTVTSRSIPIRLARAQKAELSRLTKLRDDRIADECLPFRQKLLRWANDNREALRVADAVAPEELGARQCDVWRPLFAIADVSGGHWPELARKAAVALHGVAEEEGDYGLLLLQDLRRLFEQPPRPPVLSSETIIEALVAMEDRPWTEYRNGHPITKRGLAQLIGRFRAKPTKDIRVQGSDGKSRSVKGYEYTTLEPIFTTYLPTLSASATSATNEEKGGVADVADSEGVKGETYEETERLALERAS